MAAGRAHPKGAAPAATGPAAGQDGVGRVSVVIPVYKAAEFLARAVESALNESEVFEVVLVEDGSPDDSLAMCNRLAEAHDRVNVLRHPNGENRGAGATRNLGIASAGGDFIAFLDADDYFLPGRFAGDMALLAARPDIDGVYNAIGTVFYDDAGRARYAGKGQDESHLTTMRRRFEPEELFGAMAPVGSDGHFHANGLTVRRRVFDVLSGFDTELELSQDTLLFLQMSLKCRLAPGRLDEPVAMRGVHTGNRIADDVKLQRFRPVLFEKLYAWMRREGLSKEQTGRAWLLYYHHAAVNFGGPEPLFLVRHLLQHPELLLSGAFWHKVLGKFRR